MHNRCRPLLLAVIFMTTAGAATAAAQTVLLLHAPAGATVDVTLNGAQVGAGAVAPDGQVSVPLTTAGKIGSGGLDTNVYLDVCGKAYHLVLVDNGKTPAPPEESCDRRSISGIYWVRPVNTLVVDLADATPSMLLIRGAYKPPPAPTPEGVQPARPKTPSPAGLMVTAGGAATAFSDFRTVACGDVATCTSKSYYPTYSFGAEYWFKPWVAAAASFIKPAQAKANGSTDAFSFNSGLDTRLYTIEGKIGPAYSRFKIYGHGGLDFQQSTLATSETIQATTIKTADGTVLPVPGGTQTFSNKTSGWSWMFGAGGEFWFVKKVAIYGEAGVARLHGSATDGSQAVLDSHNTFVLVGVKFRLQR